LKSVVNDLLSVQYKIQRVIIEVYKIILCSILQIEIYSLLTYIYLNRITSLTMLRIVISSIYNIIVRDKFKKKSRIISSLEKLTKKVKKKTNTSINNLEIIILFAMSL